MRGDPDYYASGGVLPGYADPSEALAIALPALSPPSRITVDAAAERHRQVDTQTYRGPWRNSFVPALVEPMKVTTSRLYRGVMFIGPARSVKTDSLIINTILHRVICMPRNMTVFHMDRDSARDFSLEKVGPMIRACPAVAERLMAGKGSDNIFDKRFLGGMRLSIAWPVISKLSARDIPDVLYTDFDRLAEDIDGEGDPWSLGFKRIQTFGSRGMVIAETSPGWPILDESWEPKTPHEAPPTKGALAIYNRGTRARRYWTCPECGHEFEPTFDVLEYPKSASPAVAASETIILCPSGNGCVMEPSQKLELDRAGRWLHESDDGRLVELDEDPRATDIASYWMQGPVAAFASWGELVKRYLEAEEDFERTGNEAPLKSTVNVDQGKPFQSRARSLSMDFTEAALRANAETFPVGIAPEETRFITMQVDVNKGYFSVMADAWGVDMERWTIDRFDIRKPPETAPRAEGRKIDPATMAEDWDALLPLLKKVYPVAGGSRGLQPLVVVCDMSGEPGVTPKAYSFFRRARKLGYGRRFRLVKGRPGFSDTRAGQFYPEKSSKGRKAAARDIPIIQVWTDTVKDEVMSSLIRRDAGHSAHHLSKSIDDRVFSEATAERRTEDGWEPKPGVRRNESFDLMVYGKAAVIVLRAENINWKRPPRWAQPVETNTLAVDLTAK